MFLLTAALLLCLVSSLNCKEFNDTETCVSLYEKGVEAYLENNFVSCVDYFENAVKRYDKYVTKLKHCRLKCQNQAQFAEPLFPVDVENLLFFEKVIRATLCIIKCKEGTEESRQMFNNLLLTPNVQEIFENAKPYEYLHICYYQTKEPQKAAASAFTYLVYNPDDKMMQDNLNYYSSLEEVDMKKIVNYLAKEYVYLYVHGADAYTNEDWTAVHNYMEESLSSYLQAENECRALCEGAFDHGWYPDFIPSIANHFTHCLNCKTKCRKKLTSLNGEKHEDLLPSHYHYLQYAYFKTKNLKAACEAVASYLLFYPNDDTMTANMKYYLTLPKVQENYFTPRPEAVEYMQRQRYEERIKKFIRTEFNNNPEPDSEDKTETPKEIEKPKDVLPKYRITWNKRDFESKERFVSDGLVSEWECRIFVNLAKMFAVLGDGYFHGKGDSPHTDKEIFKGFTIKRMAFLVYLGILDHKYLEMFMKMTEEVRIKVQEYFRLSKILYITFTHLVCRSALPGSSPNRTDFSHAVHADNCNILPNGLCIKTFPAYTWRDYSAILYLNDDFEGGEFIFSADPLGNSVQKSIKPQCGRMIAFSSGNENLHGVKSVRNGTRCAIGLWFTFDRNYFETDRNGAYRLLEKFI